jgi:capsule polysaccharide export protein KpsE/RkpR
MDERVNKTNPSDDEVNLLDYLIILAKHSRMIILTSAAVTILTYLILFILPNKYTSTARLLPPQQNLSLTAQLLDNLGSRVRPQASAGGSSMGGMATSLLGLNFPGEMYAAMMTSEAVLDHIIARFHLMKLYKTIYQEDTRKALLKNTKITCGKKDGIIVIEVTATNSKLAAEMANAFIEELHRLIQRLALQEAKERLTFLEKERLQAGHNLIKAEESLRLFSEKNSVLQIDTQTKVAIEYIARLRAEINTREVSLQVLRQQATPFNYDTIRMETEIRGLKEKLHGAESQLDNCVSDVCLPTSKTPSLVLEYLRLLRESKLHEGLYQLYSRLVETARLDMVRDVAVVQVLSPALPPEKRSNSRLIPAFLVGFSAFIFVVFVAFSREFLHKLNTRKDQAQRLSSISFYWQPYKNILGRLKNLLRLKNGS